VADAKISTFGTIAANTATFTYAYVVANGAYGKIAINASGGLPVYTATALTPYADATNAIGTNALRWNGAVLAFTTAVAWSDGTHQNTLKYVDGTGPQFLDRTTTFKTTFNTQSQSADRAYQTPNRSGFLTVDGQPSIDNSQSLGATAVRWKALLLTDTGGVGWSTGSGNANSALYADGVGPYWLDRTTTFALRFDVTGFSSDTTITWLDQNGSPALYDGSGNLQRSGASGTLGATSGEFAGLFLGLTSHVSFSNGVTGGSYLGYTDSVGPLFFDSNVNHSFTFNLQGLTSTRSQVIADADGAVPLAGDSQNSAPTTGQTVSLTNVGAPIVSLIKPLGTLSALTLTLPTGLFAGQTAFVMCTQIVTTLTVTATNIGTSGMASPSAFVANQTVAWSWNASQGKWNRFL
jgi:hypothetical protein